MGMDPSSKQRIDYCGSDKRFMSGWLNTILRPMEKEGVDFWWLDWQQDMFDRHIKTLNNTWWLNYVLFSDMERNRTTRPLLYHRWGGLGNHRYQIGSPVIPTVHGKRWSFSPTSTLPHLMCFTVTGVTIWEVTSLPKAYRSWTKNYLCAGCSSEHSVRLCVHTP